MLTSNRGFGDSGAVFADHAVATATLDRLLHQAMIGNIKGLSHRIRACGPERKGPCSRSP